MFVRQMALNWAVRCPVDKDNWARSGRACPMSGPLLVNKENQLQETYTKKKHVPRLKWAEILSNSADDDVFETKKQFKRFVNGSESFLACIF